MTQSTMNELVNLFKQNNFIEIGYITWIKKVYLS